MHRSQLSMEIEEGRAAAILGVSFTQNPYRTLGAEKMSRWGEAARNWESGYVSVADKKGTFHDHYPPS